MNHEAPGPVGKLITVLQPRQASSVKWAHARGLPQGLRGGFTWGTRCFSSWAQDPPPGKLLITYFDFSPLNPPLPRSSQRLPTLGSGVKYVFSEGLLPDPLPGQHPQIQWLWVFGGMLGDPSPEANICDPRALNTLTASLY